MLHSLSTAGGHIFYHRAPSQSTIKIRQVIPLKGSRLKSQQATRVSTHGLVKLERTMAERMTRTDTTMLKI